MTSDENEKAFLKPRDAIRSWLEGVGNEPSSDDIATGWTWPRSPQDCFGEGEWTRVFAGPGRGLLLPRNDFPLKIYRGTVPEYRLRMAWTTDRESGHVRQGLDSPGRDRVRLQHHASIMG